MTIEWAGDDRAKLEAGMGQHPASSGRCAALARIVYRVALPHDQRTQGCQVRPKGAARFVVPKFPHAPYWASHTFIDTRAHAVDALTGVEGCLSETYLQEFWQHPDYLTVHDVDVHSVDVGIENI